MNKFKPGDKVYCPKYSTSILRVDRNKSGYNSDIYPLEIAVGINYDTLTNDGKIRTSDKQPILFHATPENHALLEQLYGVEFEKPPVKPTSKEIIQAMLDRGDKYVLCNVSNYGSDDWYLVLIERVGENSGYIDDAGTRWYTAKPINPRTGIIITELPE